MPYGPKVLPAMGFRFDRRVCELIRAGSGACRDRLDEYSARSHELAAKAQDDGAFETQIMPVFTDGEPVVADEGVRLGIPLKSSSPV